MTKPALTEPVAKLRDALYRHNSGQLHEREPLSERTTYRIGGPAELLYSPYVEEDIVAAVEFANEFNVPYRVLGGGSNLLVSDNGVPGLTIELKSYFTNYSIDHSVMTVDAGISLLRLVRAVCFNNLSGMENLAGIPGTLGGGLWMNCGAFGSEISDCIKWVRGIRKNGERMLFMKEDVAWGYRQAPELKTVIVTSAQFEMPQGNRENLFARMREVLHQRRTKQPLTFPSAGSVFKRPPNDFASRLIEEAGLKGQRVGDAEVSIKHAGFIINRGHATAEDIRSLMHIIRETVREKFGITLELEQCLWGFDHAEI